MSHAPDPPPDLAANTVDFRGAAARQHDPPPPPPADEPPIPLPAVPGYQVVRELGRGGMGVVYEARQLSLGRAVALKMVLGGAEANRAEAARFLEEAKAIAAIRHPNVVHIYEFAHHEGRQFFAMEYVDGGSLHDLIRKRGRLPATEAAKLVEQVARGVQAGHDQGIIHRDLKPANVLLDPSGSPKVTDFGLARRGTSAGHTRTGTVMGTPAYMAPEQARGQNSTVAPPTDVYALGVILFECLTGRTPFVDKDPIAVMMAVATQPPPAVRSLAPDVPRELEQVCMKCLAKRQTDRYPTAGALADDLRRFTAGDPTAALPPFRRPAVRVGVIAAAAVLVVLAGVAGWLLTKGWGKSASPTDPVSTPAPTRSVAELFASTDFVWGPPVNLGDGVNTTEVERMPALTADELTMVYDRQGKLHITRRTSRTEPFPAGEPLPDAITDLQASLPSLSGDGLLLAFCSTLRPPHVPNVWVSERATTDDPFGPPTEVETPVNPSQWNQSPILSDDGLTLVFTSLPQRVGYGNGDLVMSRRRTRTDPFPAANTLQPPVSTKDYDTASWVSPDGRVLVATDKPPGVAESYRLLTRLSADGPFDTPRPFDPFAGVFKLGRPWFTPDGRRMYFHARDTAAGRKDLDLWVSELMKRD